MTNTEICRFAVVERDVVVGSWLSEPHGQVRIHLPPYGKEAHGGTSHAAGASGTVKLWLVGGRSCFALPETSQFLQEAFVEVAQPKEKKLINVL